MGDLALVCERLASQPRGVCICSAHFTACQDYHGWYLLSSSPYAYSAPCPSATFADRQCLRADSAVIQPLCSQYAVPIRLAVQINNVKQGDLTLVCKQFLNKPRVDNVVLTTVDRLGLDIRVTSGSLTDEYRIGFRQARNFLRLAPL